MLDLPFEIGVLLTCGVGEDYMAKHNIKLFVLLMTISIVSFSGLLAGKKDPTALTKTMKKFYSDKKWGYFEKILIKELGLADSKTENITKNIGKAILAIPAGFSCFMDQKIGLDFEGAATSIILIGIGSAIGFFSADFISWLFLTKKIKREKIIRIFELFFEKYNPEINEDANELNTRELVPEELHETFDDMYQDYLDSGKDGLKECCLDIYDFIIEKIEYEVKGEIYKEKRKDRNRQGKRFNEVVRNIVNVTRD